MAYGESKGVVIAMEPHVGSALDLPDKTLWLLEQIDNPYLKLNFDISHFDVLGLPTADTVSALAPHAAHTHVKDQTGRFPEHEFLIPGEGPFDFVEYLAEMEKAGYTGYITAEVSFMVQRRPDYFVGVEPIDQTCRRSGHSPKGSSKGLQGSQCAQRPHSA